MVTKGTLLLLNAFHVVLGDVSESQRSTNVKIANKKITDTARTVTELIQKVEGATIHEVLYDNVLLRIKCANVRAMKQVLKKLQRADFKAILTTITEVLKETFGETFHAKGHIMESCVHEIEGHLSK